MASEANDAAEAKDDAKELKLDPKLLQTEQFEELLTCAVCLDRYNKPKLLPCQHTFCQEPCMEGLVNWLYRKLDCPECRAEHRVPIGGVQNFPNNLTIISFLDLTARAAGLTPQPPPPQPMSHLDYLKPRLPPAQEVSSVTGIARMTNMARQEVSESTSSAITSFAASTPQTTPCPLCETPQPELMHCSHCQRRICQDCKDTHVEGLKSDIGRVVHQIRRGFIRLEDAVRGWEAKEEQLKTNLEASKSEIADTFTKYIKELENRRDVINTEVDMFATSEGRRMATQKEQVQNVLQQMTTFCETTEEQISNGDSLTDSELMNVKHQCGLNMNSLRAYGPENIDSKRIRFKAETRHLNAAIVVFGQVIETGTGSHASHLTSRGSPSDSPSDSPRTNRPFTSRFLTAERERAAAAAAAAASNESSAAASGGSSAAVSAEASTENIAVAATTADDASPLARNNSFQFAGQGRRLGGSPSAPSVDTSSTDVAARRLAALTGNRTNDAANVAGDLGGNASATPAAQNGGGGGDGRRPSCDATLTNGPGLIDRSVSSPASVFSSDGAEALSLEGAAGGASGGAESSDGLFRHVLRRQSDRGRAETERLVLRTSDALVTLTPPPPRSESADRDGSGLHPDFTTREVSPDDDESVTSRIMRRLNNMGLGFEEVAAFSSGRSTGRSHQPQAASASETQLTDYLTKSSTRVKFGRRGADVGCFTWPRGIAVNGDGEIVVADSSNHRIQVFDGHGEFLRQFGQYGQADGEFDCLAGVCVNKANGQIVIADRYNHRIQIFTSQGGWIRSFGEEGYWDGQMSYPWGVACAPDGNIFVCDKENHRVQVFHPNGTFMYSFGRLGCDDGCFENPHYVSVSEDGDKVVVSDSGNHRIQIFTPTGQHEQTIGREGTLNGQFKYPRGVLFDREGFILVGDSGNNRVQVFRPDGSYYASFMTWGSMEGQVKGIEGLALTADGGVVVCDRENHRIQIM